MASQFDDQQGDAGFRRRRPRPVTDYGSSVVQWMNKRLPAYKGTLQYEQERPSQSYVFDVLPPSARLNNPAESIPTRFLHQSLGKSKKPVTVVRWMPEGRRLLAGVHNGEFMLWNGMSFNFETVTAMGSSSIRAAEWSYKKDWLISANDEGTIFYLQPTLNNPHQFKGHDAPIRDLAFAPTDSKFVTASDDNTLKIWDFVSSANESTFKDHGWDVKACDWHPTKGLVVSGSKDHSVRLWDPRTTRNLTTLHGHKNAITATVFSRLRDQLLATAGRDSQVRIFDLRMMRDVVVLRGHEKGVTTIAWHPIHPSIISSGGEDGSLHTYLLTEPNTPAGISTATLSPYSTPDPRSAPAQSIYPAHKIPYAHDSAAWSLDWHPMGHILASGSNDHYTRFWSRSQPGQTDSLRDKYHLGEEGAEAQGTWDKKMSSRQAREQEEQEEQDEAEGLEDQNNTGPGTFSIPGLPGLQGLPGLGSLTGGGNTGPLSNAAAIPPSQSNGAPQPPGISLPGMGIGMSQPPGSMGMLGSGFPPPPPIPLPGQTTMPGLHQQPPPISIPGMDPASLQRLIQSQQQQQGSSYPPSQNLPYPLPPIPGAGAHQQFQIPPGFPPPPPGTNGAGAGVGAAPSSAATVGIPGLGGQFNLSGIPGLPQAGGMADVNAGNAGNAGNTGARRRAPLPSQQEGFKAEQARGNFRVAR